MSIIAEWQVVLRRMYVTFNYQDTVYRIAPFPFEIISILCLCLTAMHRVSRLVIIIIHKFLTLREGNHGYEKRIVVNEAPRIKVPYVR